MSLNSELIYIKDNKAILSAYTKTVLEFKSLNSVIVKE